MHRRRVVVAESLPNLKTFKGSEGAVAAPALNLIIELEAEHCSLESLRASGFTDKHY
jgi:hypothetical protein